MTTTTPILSIPEVSPTQASKETTINTGFAILEAASNASKDQDATAGDLTLSVNDWTKYFFHRVFGHTVARTITVPATDRFCIFFNDGTDIITIHIAGGSGDDLDIGAGKTVLIASDAVDIKPMSSGVSNLADLNDVNVPSPADGDILVYDDGTGKWIAGAQAIPAPSHYTADHTAALTDESTLAMVDKATAINFTIPPNSSVAFVLGSKLPLIQTGVGQVTVVAGAGVTLLNPSDTSPKTRVQYSALEAVKLDTDTWAVIGDLASA